LIVVHFALPGTIGSLKGAFFPKGGLIAEQRGEAGWAGSGRVADISPSMEQFKHSPLIGQGFGTYVVEPKPGGGQNILDDQWLGTLLETGIVGVLAWSWLFIRAVRRFGRAAKDDDTHRGLLFATLAASIAAYSVGMVTYDAFSFVQVTFVMFVLLGLGASVLTEQPSRAASLARLRGMPGQRLALRSDA
jgi:hypothetical protein